MQKLLTLQEDMLKKRKTFLQDPVQARVAWHDAKKHATLLRMLVSNLRSGTYGAMPETSREACDNLERVLEDHMLLLDALSIISRDGNGALTWKASPCDIAEIFEDARRLSKYSLIGKSVVFASVPKYPVDTSLFLYFLRAAIAIVSRVAGGETLSFTFGSDADHASFTLSADVNPDILFQDDCIAQAVSLSHTTEPWQGISLSIAGIDSIVQSMNGHWRLVRESDQVILEVYL